MYRSVSRIVTPHQSISHQSVRATPFVSWNLMAHKCRCKCQQHFTFNEAFECVGHKFRCKKEAGTVPGR